MEEFQEYRKNQFEELIMECVEKINDTTTLEELKTVWADMPVEAKNNLTAMKDEKKKHLQDLAKNDESIKV